MANPIDTDCFKFNEQKLFAALRKTIVPASETQNIVECKDDMIFVWNSVDCNVMCFNWRAANARNDDTVKYQVTFSIVTFAYLTLDITSHTPRINLFAERFDSVLEFFRSSHFYQHL